MVFKSNKQRKAVMAQLNQGTPSSNVNPFRDNIQKEDVVMCIHCGEKIQFDRKNKKFIHTCPAPTKSRFDVQQEEMQRGNVQ